MASSIRMNRSPGTECETLSFSQKRENERLKAKRIFDLRLTNTLSVVDAIKTRIIGSGGDTSAPSRNSQVLVNVSYAAFQYPTLCNIFPLYGAFPGLSAPHGCAQLCIPRIFCSNLGGTDSANHH